MSDPVPTTPTKHCTNGECHEEMFLLGGFYVCGVCDIVAVPTE